MVTDNILKIMYDFVIENKNEFIIGIIFFLIPILFTFFNKQIKNIYLYFFNYFFGKCYVEFSVIYNSNIKEHIIKKEIKKIDYFKHDFNYRIMPNEEFLIERKKEKINFRKIKKLKSEFLLNLKILERNLNKIYENKVENFNEFEFNIKIYNFNGKISNFVSQRGKIKIKNNLIEIYSSKFENIDYLLKKVLK